MHRPSREQFRQTCRCRFVPCVIELPSSPLCREARQQLRDARAKGSSRLLSQVKATTKFSCVKSLAAKSTKTFYGYVCQHSVACSYFCICLAFIGAHAHTHTCAYTRIQTWVMSINLNSRVSSRGALREAIALAKEARLPAEELRPFEELQSVSGRQTSTVIRMSIYIYTYVYTHTYTAIYTICTYVCRITICGDMSPQFLETGRLSLNLLDAPVVPRP